MKQPILRQIPLIDFIPGRDHVITMDPKAWDKLLEGCYNAGWVLLEMKNDRPVKAYRKEGAN